MDPFASRNVLKLKELDLWPAKVWHGFQLDANLQSESLHLAEGAEVGLSDLEPNVLKLSLEDLSLDFHHTGRASTASQPDADALDQETSQDSDTDIWDAASLSCKEVKNGLLSWDQFNNQHIEPQPTYLSEAREAAFDAVMSQRWQAENHEILRYARLDVFIQAALNVLVGRSSQVFMWDNDTRSFACQLTQVAISGHSTALVDRLYKTLCQCGSMFRVVQDFCKATGSKSATNFALQSSLLQILGAIETGLQQKMNTLVTIMRISDICNKYAEIYKILQTIVGTAQHPGDEADILATVIENINEIWTANVLLRPMLTDLADRILQPSLRQTQQQIDLSTDSGALRTDRWVFASLLPEDDSVFQEIITCSQVSRENGVQIRPSRSNAAPVRMAHQWSDIIEMQQMADLLEVDFCNDFTHPDRLETGQIETSVSTDNMSLPRTDPFAINFDMAPRDLPSVQHGSVRNTRLSNRVLAVLGDEGDEVEAELSPRQMLSMSLRPMLSAQHRISSYALLRSLFLQYNLVAHLDLLYSYHLLGNGTFAARLSRALFDADQYSAEGRRKTGLTAGLRLENRDVWPPASSELRLVLMGLLSEATTNKQAPNLIESISFAIRDLSEEEMELCRDVHSVHALDFLRLTYAPPNHILELIITPTVLDKYDRVSKFLLILLRMHALSQNLLRGVINRNANLQPNKHYHRFCLELHQFVTSFLDYALNIALSTLWNKMIRFFEEIHDTLLKDDYSRCMSIVASVNHLSKMHADTLDDVLAALLLKKSQAKLHRAMCEIFQMGLHAAQNHPGSPHEKTSAMQYKQLREALDNWFSLVEMSTRRTANRDIHMVDFLLNQVDGSKYYRRAQEKELPDWMR